MKYVYYDIHSANLKTIDESGTVLSGIHKCVADSEMTNKNLNSCTWDEDSEILEIEFTGELVSADKDILDLIVSGNCSLND